jgi:hypothetical protein
VNNFIDRRKDNLAPDHNIFGRTLARRTGAAIGAITGLVAPTLFKSATDYKINFYKNTPDIIKKTEDIVANEIANKRWGLYSGFSSKELYGGEAYNQISTALAEKNIDNYIKPLQSISSGLSNINKGLSTVIGGGIGSVAGVALYDNFIAGKVEDI